MTGQDIVDNVRTEVVEPNPAFFTNAALLRWLNAAQLNYVRRVRCLQNFATTSTVQGQPDYPMPSDWLGAEKIFYNSPIGGVDRWLPLEATSLTKLSQENPNFLSSDPARQAAPRLYYIVNKTLYVYPRPATSGTNDIFMFYECKPVTMTALGDPLSVDDSLADGLEAYLLWKLYKMDQEPESAMEQATRFAEEIKQGFKWKKKQQLDGKWKIDIQSGLPFNYAATNSGHFGSGINPLNI